MKGSCLCGNVNLSLEEAPEYINICNCRFCRSAGAAWGYYRKAQVSVEGETKTIQRDDLDEIWLDRHFCANCGSCTHYSVVKDEHRDRIAVNTRLFVQDDLDGIEVRFLDGRMVDDDEFIRTGDGKIGDGKSF